MKPYKKSVLAIHRKLEKEAKKAGKEYKIYPEIKEGMVTFPDETQYKVMPNGEWRKQ